MVSSRHRTSTASTSASDSPVTRVLKPPLEEWTIREKLCLASLAIKHNNSWNTVARHMLTFASDKERQDGRYNQKICAAQFDKLMNELGVDKRPKRNEQTDASGSVIYKKMTEKRIDELENNTKELRRKWLKVCEDLNIDDDSSSNLDKPEPNKSKSKNPASSTSKTPTKVNTSISGDIEKPPTRALTRRESSRKNLEKTLSTLYREAMEIKQINQLCKPSPELEKSFGAYDKLILKHVEMSSMEKYLDSEVDDPYAVMNDLMLVFQNATMYYPIDHPTYKIAADLREKLLPLWSRSLLDRTKPKH